MRTEESTALGWNAAVSVLSAGTAKPKPMPRKAVATNRSGNATDALLWTNALAIKSSIETRPAARPTR